jgi:hypothetical protein
MFNNRNDKIKPVNNIGTCVIVSSFPSEVTVSSGYPASRVHEYMIRDTSVYNSGFVAWNSSFIAIYRCSSFALEYLLK